MSEKYDWLPARVEFDYFGGDWFRYLEALYQVYMKTLVWDRARFQNKPVLTIKEPMRDGKEETFWHIIEGREEKKCETDFDRCACVPWIRPIIEAHGSSDIKIWVSEKRPKNTISVPACMSHWMISAI